MICIGAHQFDEALRAIKAWQIITPFINTFLYICFFSPGDDVIQYIQALHCFIASQDANLKSLLTCLQQVIYDLLNRLH